MRCSFRVFGKEILGLGSRLVNDWYAIKVLIINAETRFRDFSLFWKGSVKKNEKKIYIGEYRKGVKSCNRVPKIFGRFLSLGFLWGFWQIFGGEFLWGFWRGRAEMAKNRLFRQWLHMQLSYK